MQGRIHAYRSSDKRGDKFRRRDREAEGTPLLREHAGKTCIEGSNPSVSANNNHALVWLGINWPT